MRIRFPEEERLPAWKIAFLQYTIAVAFLMLLGGYWRLQIGQHRLLLDQAERNRIRYLPIIAPRGRILDREGRVLVDSTPAFTILLTREGGAPLTPARIEAIARGLRLDLEELQRQLERASHLPHFQPVLIKSLATPKTSRSSSPTASNTPKSISSRCTSGSIPSTKRRLRCSDTS